MGLGTCLLICMCCGAEPEPARVCLTELWEVYDYRYPDGEDSYAELVSWAWTVEVPSELANGMTGWTFAGFVRTTRIVRHDRDEEIVESCWSTHTGKTGWEATTEDAVRRVSEQHYGPNARIGKIDIIWR